jgi:hypothetical protein
MGYADLQIAMHDIGLDASSADDADKIGRLAVLDDEIARLIDIKTGRTFGGTAAPLARVVQLPVSWGNDLLLLPFPIRSASSVVITGDYAETLDSTDYVLTFGTELTGDYHALRRIDGQAWPYNDGRSTLTVTGQWSHDAPGGAVPDEIVAAATFLVVEEWRLRESSPAGQIGPDGLTIIPRNPWGFEIVKTAIDHYGAARSMVTF